MIFYFQNVRRRIVTGLMVGVCGGVLVARAQEQHITGGQFNQIEVRDTVERFYFEDQLQPCALMKAAWIHKDYERMGFFRVGVLPLVAVDGFQFEVQTPGLAAYSFACLQDRFMEHSHVTSRLELRQPAFVVDTPGPHRLECARARISPDGEWKLSGGVSLFLGTNQVRSAQATLQVTGEKAGRLVMGGAGSPVDFFSTNLVLQPSNNRNSL